MRVQVKLFCRYSTPVREEVIGPFESIMVAGNGLWVKEKGEAFKRVMAIDTGVLFDLREGNEDLSWSHYEVTAVE